MTGITIRKTTADETAAILALYPLAFPDEDLRPIVSSLLGGPDPVLSLAALDGDALAGHILFTRCGMSEGDLSGALLAPLAVHPSHQRQGVGTALIQAGHQRLAADGVRQVLVLGDPAYYSRHGFAPEREVRAPYPIPAEWADAWQSLTLAGRGPMPPGTLVLPKPWMDPALW